MLNLVQSGVLFALWLGGGTMIEGPTQDLKERFGVKGNVTPKAADADSPLPEGYPGGTAPGTIEVKHYPAYRSAVARNPKANGLTGDMLFWPLFNHISKSNIEMTAPVINSYPEAMIETPSSTGEITMEFLYRSTKQGEPGPGVGKVEVKDGNMIAGNFQTGQTLEQSFTLQPGKCYTAIAVGAGPGMQVDISMVATAPVPIPGFNPQFGSAAGKPTPTGSQAVLGSKGGCIKLALSPMPVQAKYVVTVSKGAGVVAAQLYSK